MTERRYQEDEVREIFSLITSGKVSEAPARNAADGLTLEDMQSIGAEVGLSPDLVARAAARLDEQSRKGRTSFGLPIETGRTVMLRRGLTDREWAQIVAELRSMFRAHGKLSGMGELREWSNGNLHVAVEPVANGYRARMGTLKSDAIGVNAIGVSGVVAGIVTAASLGLAGEPAPAFMVPAFFSAAGVSAFIMNRLRIPRWMRLRERQFEQIADKLKAMTDERNDTV